MKKIFLEFCRRGMIASGFGPIVLAIVYLILDYHSSIRLLTVNQVYIGIFSLSALAFIAGGMNVVYQIERLPLMYAIFLHGIALYVVYLITYLINDWIVWGLTPIFVFTGIFVFSYIVIWIFIYTITKKNTDKINQILIEKHQTKGE